MDADAPVLLLLKATLLLGVAFAAVRWDRSAPAARRHGVWSATFIALLALPLFALALPRLHVPVPDWRPAPAAARETDAPTTPDLPAAAGAREGVRRDGPRPVAPSTAVTRLNPLTAPRILLLLWLIGVALALVGLTRSLLRVRRLAADGRPIDDPDWAHTAHHVAHRLGLATVPRLVTSPRITTPMAGHVGEPIVFLPLDAAGWDAERREVVLTHEMTHLLRRDPFRIVAARLTCSLYWFHPLMWVAARQATADCEQACDEHVLTLGIRPSVYARVLLDFANQPTGPMPGVALPIVRPHRLETRVMAILSNPVARRRQAASPFRTLANALGAVLVFASVAAARPAADDIEALPASVALVPESATASPPKVAEPIEPEHLVNPSPLPQSGRCWNEYSRGGSFSGSTHISNGRTLQRIGRTGGERVAQMTFGDLRVCMITIGYEGDRNRDDDAPPSSWISRSDRVILETDNDGDVRRLEIADGRSSWSINGRSSDIDDRVTTWRRAMLDLLDNSWEASSLRGRESSLRGEISSIHGERSSLRGQISSLRGEVSSMLGEISSIRGEESSLRGEISSIRGHESSLRGQISSERGAISSLEAQRWERADRDAINARIRRHEDRIREIEREIERFDADGRVRAVQRRIDAHDTDRQVAEVERRLREFDVEKRVTEIEHEISRLDVDGKVRGIDGEIRSLDVDRRMRVIDERRDEALERLRAALRR
jgi:beta-lactamase regulating signal transducer with metallopeptidase domain